MITIQIIVVRCRSRVIRYQTPHLNESLPTRSGSALRLILRHGTIWQMAILLTQCTYSGLCASWRYPDVSDIVVHATLGGNFPFQWCNQINVLSKLVSFRSKYECFRYIGCHCTLSSALFSHLNSQTLKVQQQGENHHICCCSPNVAMPSYFRMSVSVLLAILSAVQGIELVAKRTGPVRYPSCVDFTPFVYGGCFSDNGSPRTLIFSANLDFKTMTVDKCVAFCKGINIKASSMLIFHALTSAGNGYRYAGLEYYGECFCGASVNGAQIDEANCRLPCTGNATESCGGNKAISVYQDPTFQIVDWTTITGYMSIGCYTEGTTGRTLAWKQGDPVTGPALTVEKCLSACKGGGYAFAGLQYGRECYCGVSSPF